MEVGTEISQKIRSAIKAKLMELGAYVDDELPDYIMVMVANKKSRAQMNSDLGLFLGTNTSAFTEWLHSLLGKLQTIRGETDKSSDKHGKGEKSKGSKDKKKEKDKSHKGESSGKKDAKDKKKTGKRSTDIVVKRKAASEAEGSKETEPAIDADNSNPQNKSSNEDMGLGLVGGNKRSGEKDISEKKTGDKSKNTQDDVEDVRQLLVTEAPSDELAEELETTEAEVVSSRTVTDISSKPAAVSRKRKSGDVSPSNASRSPSPDKRNVQTSNVTRKRRAPTSVVASVSRGQDDEEEYDPYNPAVGSVASVVKVTTRKSSVPPSMQANRETADTGDEESKNTQSEEPQAEIGEPPAKAMKFSESVHLEDIKKALSEVLENAQSRNDDLTHFSRMVESSLRKLPLQYQSPAKVRIQQVLFEFESLDARKSQTGGLRRKEDISIQASTLNCQPACNNLNSEAEETALNVSHLNSSLISESRNDHMVEKLQTLAATCDDGQRNASSNDEPLLSCSTSTLVSEANESHPVRRIFYPKSKSSESSTAKSFQSQDKGKDSSEMDSGVKSGERERRLSGRSQPEDQKPQSPVSSSKIDTGSPNSVHSCPPSSTSGLDVRRCIVSTSSKSRESTLSPVDLKSKQSDSPLVKSSPSAVKHKPMPAIFVDSIHSRKRPESESTSVLKQSGIRDRSPRGALPTDTDESFDSPRQFSSEALKVMAKNLKVTVINKRATKPQQGSSSSESSSDDSDNESSDEEEEEESETSQGKEGKEGDSANKEECSPNQSIS